MKLVYSRMGSRDQSRVEFLSFDSGAHIAKSLSKLLKRATCLLEGYRAITAKSKPYSSFFSVSLSLREGGCNV